MALEDLGPATELAGAMGEAHGFPGREEVEGALAARPEPTSPRDYDVNEASFWEGVFIPDGSVVEYRHATPTNPDLGLVAVQVLDHAITHQGVTFRAKFVAAQYEHTREELAKVMKGARKKYHICRLEDSACPLQHLDLHHLEHFTWYPPGDYHSMWCTAAGRKVVAAGLKLHMANQEKAGHPGKKDAEGGTAVEKRLSALKAKANGHPRVTFDPFVGKEPGRSTPGAPLAIAVDGINPGGPATSSRLGASTIRPRSIKDEPIVIPSDEDRRRRLRSRSPRLGDQLAQAVLTRRKREEKEKTRKRSRSREKRKRKRSKKSRLRRRSSSSSSGRSRTPSSSDDSLVPPLRRKSDRQPGSVFKMLEEQAAEQLAADGLVDPDEVKDGRSGRPRMYTYYQLLLKPGLDPRARDAKELSTLARCLDLLADGKLPQLADALAARLVAIDVASRQGWNTARHLELWGGEEEGSVPAHILLRAQRHGRQVDKAGGKGSWRPSNWAPSFTENPKGKGKSKNKGKTKGKGKGSGKNWGQEKDPPESGKKAEG